MSHIEGKKKRNHEGEQPTGKSFRFGKEVSIEGKKKEKRQESREKRSGRQR